MIITLITLILLTLVLSFWCLGLYLNLLRYEYSPNEIDYSDIPETDQDFWEDAKTIKYHTHRGKR